jgi:hypothetical protein
MQAYSSSDEYIGEFLVFLLCEWHSIKNSYRKLSINDSIFFSFVKISDQTRDTILHKYKIVKEFNLVIFKKIYLLRCNAM